MNRIGWAVCTGVAAMVLLTPRWAAADDRDTCIHESGDVAIAACTRQINSGRYSGKSLAIAYMNRGVEWKKKEEYDKALADYDKSIQLDSQSADTFYNRCRVYLILHKYDAALADCNRALALPPPGDTLTDGNSTTADENRADYFQQRGKVYIDRGEYDRAIADLDQAIRLVPDDRTYFYDRASAYYRKKDYDNAVADFSMALRLKPDYALALYWRGRAKQEMGDTGGDKDIAAAKKINPDVDK